jgi:hypothetical protein
MADTPDVNYILHKAATNPASSQPDRELNFVRLFVLAEWERRKKNG